MAFPFAPADGTCLVFPLRLASGLSNLLREGLPNKTKERFFPEANLFQLTMLKFAVLVKFYATW